MLRVLHCIYDDPDNPWVAGGGALRVREIYERLSDRVEVTVATGNFPGAQNECRAGVRYRRLGARGPYPWSRLTYSRAATRLLRGESFDAGVFDFSVYTPIRLPATRQVGLIVHMLHGPTAVDRFGRFAGGAVERAERQSLRRGHWVSTTSLWMAEQLRPVLRADASLSVVGSGVPEAFTRVRRQERDFFLYYGRFDIYQKGLDTVLNAFARIAAEDPTVRLCMAGRGKDEGKLREMAHQSGVGTRIEILAGVDRSAVLELLAGAIALLMPSRLEGLPMVPAEAMAAGVPVIGADVGGVAEVIAPPAGGLLVPPGDPEALAATALALLHDPQRRRIISETARTSATRFSWDLVADQHLSFLRTIAASA